MKLTVENKVSVHLLQLSNAELLKAINDFVYVFEIECCFPNFHLGISFNDWKRDLFDSSLLDSSLLDSYMAGYYFIHASRRKTSFLKRLNQNNWVCCCVKVIFQASDFVQCTTCLWVILEAIHRLFLPSNKQADPPIYNLYTGDSGGVDFLIKFKSFWIFSSWVASAFQWQTGRCRNLAELKLEHLPGCPCSDKPKQIGNRATWG